jgi:hypothetical protein
MHHALQDFIRRFQDNPSDEWFRSTIKYEQPERIPENSDPELLLRVLHENLETAIYVPTSEGIRIARWIYEKSRGFGAHRFQSLERYVDVSMARDCDIEKYCDPELVPIYLIDGLPGYGKSALTRALRRILPPPGESTAEGDPPQRIRTLSALWVKINKSFSMNTFVRDTLLSLDIEIPGKNTTFLPLARLLFKTLYRMGATCMVVDELQFASGRESSERALGHLLAMRNFGVPIFAFTNTDFIVHVMNAPGQVAQRIAFMKQTIRPITRGEPEFSALVEAQLKLVPFGHDIKVAKHALDLYDTVAGSPRGTARLIEVAVERIIRARRPLHIMDLLGARHSPSFEIFNNHTALLSTLNPVDIKKNPEFSSNNDQFDPGALIRQQLDERRMEDAAAVSLYASYNTAEREAAQAATVKIMRDAGKIPGNIAALGEAKRPQKSKKRLEEKIATSFATEHLSKSVIPIKPATGKDADKQ